MTPHLTPLSSKIKSYFTYATGDVEKTSHEEEPSLRHRIISFKTMEPRLRLLSGLAMAQVLACMILIALREIPGEQISFPLPGPGEVVVDISIVVFLVTLASIVLGLAFVVAGVFSAHPVARAWIALVVAVIFALFVAAAIHNGEWGAASLVGLLLFYSGTAGLLVRKYYQHWSPDRRKPWVIWPFVFLCAVVPILLIWAINPSAFAATTILIGLALLYLFLVTGTDWAEIVDTGACRFSKILRDRRVGWLATATGLVSVIGIVQVVSQHGWGVIAFVPPMALAVALVAISLGLAHFRGDWPIHIPAAALAVSVITFELLGDVAFSHGISPDITWFLVALIMAALLWRHSRRQRVKWLPVILYVLLLAITPFLTSVPVLENAITWKEKEVPVPLPEGPLLLASVGALGFLPCAIARRRKQQDIRNELQFVLILNVALLLLYWLSGFVYEKARSAGEALSVTRATIIFIALAWDVLVSGHQITNREGTLFPRRSRVLLFFGYIILVATTVLFWASVRKAPQKYSEKLADPERFVQLGISRIGPPLVIALFILRFGREVSHTGSSNKIRAQ